MILHDQPTIFGDRVIVTVSSIEDGPMNFKSNDPEKFTDKSLREVYFSAWSKDIITKRFPDGLSETSDGGMRLYLGTRLPNVIMEYAYAKDKKLPTRRLLLAPRMNG